MKSNVPKVLHRVAGRPMIEHTLRTARSLSPATITLIVGHQAAAVQKSWLHSPDSASSSGPQLGTAHALQQAEGVLANRSGTLVLLYGDVPPLTAATCSV